MPTIFPTPLRSGDKIALVAPASVPNRETIERFASEWRSRGYELDVSERIYDRCGYLAGTDEIRAEEFMRVFIDPLSRRFSRLAAATESIG